MSSIGRILAPAASIGRSLAQARAANPRASVAGSFDQHLDLALLAGVGGGAGGSSTGEPDSAQSRVALDDMGGFASIEALRSEHRAVAAQFEDRFRRLLQERGINLGRAISLQTDMRGDVRVTSEHPDKEAIERLIHDDAELRTLFTRLADQASLLRSADRAAELPRLQAEAPSDAATRVQQLPGSTSSHNFVLTVQPHEVLAQFN
jgi:hypothetical protein